MNYQPIFLDIRNVAIGKVKIYNGIRAGIGLIIVSLVVINYQKFSLIPTIVFSLSVPLLIGIGRKNMWALRLFFLYFIVLIITLVLSKINWKAWIILVFSILQTFTIFGGLSQYISGIATSPISFLKFNERSWKCSLQTKINLVYRQFLYGYKRIGFKGWVLSITGFTLLFFAAYIQFFDFDPFYALGLAEKDSSGVLAISIASLGIIIFRFALEFWMPHAALIREIDPRRPILLLRSFKDDRLQVESEMRYDTSQALRVKKDYEEIISEQLKLFGPVIAVGEPGEERRPLGAARQYMSNEEWQQKVGELAKEALIIILILGRTKGVKWELSRLAQLNQLKKVILVIPPVKKKEVDKRISILNELVKFFPQSQALVNSIDENTITVNLYNNQFPILINGQKKHYQIKEAVRTAVGTINLKDQDCCHLLDHSLDRSSRFAIQICLARFYFIIGEYDQCLKALHLFNELTSKIRNSRVLLFNRIFLKIVFPSINDVEKTEPRYINHDLLRKFIIEKGLSLILEIAKKENYYDIQTNNWRIANTVKYLLRDSKKRNFDILNNAKENKKTKNSCSFCHTHSKETFSVLKTNNNGFICNFCIEIIDSLQFNGLLPDPTVQDNCECSFCGRSGPNLVLCNNGDGINICLFCAKYPYLAQTTNNKQVVRTPFYKREDFITNLYCNNSWRIMWSLTRLQVANATLIFKKHHDRLIDLFAHEIFEVRETAISLCTYPTFKNIKLLFLKLFEDNPLIRGCAVSAVGFNPNSLKNKKRLLDYLREVYKKEKNDLVKSRIIGVLENIKGRGSLDFLNQMEHFEDQTLQNQKLVAIDNVKKEIDNIKL